MPAATMAQHHYSFPVVTGIDARDPLASRKARMAVYQRLLAELDANGQHISEQISEIDLTDPEDARVLMPEQGADILAHFGEDRFLERYQRYKAHIAEWRQQYPKLAAVDLRYDQQVVLEMAPGTNAANVRRAIRPRRARITASRRQRMTRPCRKRASPPMQDPANMRAAKPAVKGKKQKAGARHGKPESTRRTSKAKTAAARNKKPAPRQAALNVSQHKPAATTHPAAAGGPVSAMSQRQDNLIVVLDMGSAWTRVLAADVNEGALRYRGHGVVESAGMRKGLISELAPAAKAVKAASEQAERVARANIGECVVGVGGPHIRGINTNGGFELGNRMREIYREDVRTAVERARAVERPPDREILHLLPRQFILDEPAGHLRSRGHGGRAAGGGPAHRHLLRQRAAKHGDLRQPGGP